MKKAFLLTIIFCAILLGCNSSSVSSSVSRIDSVKADNRSVYLDQSELGRFLYFERGDFDTQDLEDYSIGQIHCLDLENGTESTIRVGGNDYPTYLVQGESDSIVCLFSIGGSGGYCGFSRINLDKKEETTCRMIGSNFFELDSITAQGYHGHGYYRWQEAGGEEDVPFKVIVDYWGNETFLE